MKKGSKSETKECPKCSRQIGISQFGYHDRVCGVPKIKKPKKIRGVDFDPNWGYKAGTRQAWNKGLTDKDILEKGFRINPQKKFSDEEAFSVHSPVSRGNAKKRILQKNLIEYKCEKCEIFEWNGIALTLHLDHINGIWDDHRLLNLRFLCPNCHSQTNTYAGKNKAYKRPVSIVVNAEVSKTS